MRRSLLLLGLTLAACGPAAPPPVAPVAPPQPSVAPAPPAPTATDPSLAVLLRPSAKPSPLVHVEIDVVAPGAALAAWQLGEGSPDRIARATAHDAKGALGVDVKAHGDGGAVDLALDRPPSGPVHLEYDVLAVGDAPDDPRGVLVVDDRFRGVGERLIALPTSIEDQPLPITLTLDGAQIHDARMASSLGFGATRHTSARARALRYAVFLGGALSEAMFDAAQGHDEAVWVGEPAFDPRGAISELAQLRTDLAQMLRAEDLLPGLPETYLIEASASRHAGGFDVTPRFQSVLVQLGMGERWSAPVQLAVTHLLARRWIGDAIRFAAAPEKGSELGWFNDGVAHYLGMRLLARAGFLAPDAWAQTIAGQLSTLATSPYATTGNAELGALVAKDPRARAAMMVRGALYAARESAAITAHSKGDLTLEHALGALLHQARTEQKGGPLPPSAWLDVLAKDDPDAARTFDALIVHGGPISFPSGALGPCFRAGTGDYVGFDAGFDLEATRAAKDAKVIGVRAGGPAAKAGLKDGDVLGSVHVNEGDARVPVDLEITRDGKTVSVSYLPAGVHARAQTWTRVKGVPDDRCGFPP